MKNPNQLWKAILAEIEIESSEASFFTLFKRTSLLSVENNVATIAAPSAMIIDLIQKRFYQILKKASEKHIGKDIKIIFVPKTIEVEKLATKDVLPLFSKAPSAKTIGHLPRIRADYTFENMAVSSTNQLAYASGVNVAKNPGKSYNPLFIYGPVGVGKTHLMQAIANSIYKHNSENKIAYLTSEEFTNEVVEAIRSNNTSSMKKRFRGLNCLIIDDVQFLSGKERVQEELFHTFNILVDNASQVILSSDRPPEEMKKIEKRLLSRFTGGLTVDIGSPDFELRTAILLIKAKARGINLSMETAKKIAESAVDARALEGILLKISTRAQSENQEITTPYVEGLLGVGAEKKRLSWKPEEIIKSICLFYEIKPTQLKGDRRNSGLVKARQIAMYLLKRDGGLTFSEIGNLLGGRDHTTIIHGVNKITGIVDKKGFSEEIMGITRLIKDRPVDY